MLSDTRKFLFLLPPPCDFFATKNAKSISSEAAKPKLFVLDFLSVRLFELKPFYLKTHTHYRPIKRKELLGIWATFFFSVLFLSHVAFGPCFCGATYAISFANFAPSKLLYLLVLLFSRFAKLGHMGFNIEPIRFGKADAA